MTAENVRQQAIMVDALLLAFENTYLDVFDRPEDLDRDTERAVFAFYALRDLVMELVNDLDSFSEELLLKEIGIAKARK